MYVFLRTIVAWCFSCWSPSLVRISQYLRCKNISSFSAVPECNLYKILNDSDRHNNFGRGDQKCDNHLTKDWYRFSAGTGTRIPSHCIPVHRCGTNLPGWMDGEQPIFDEGVVTRKVCFHGYNNCCYRDIMIDIRNCGSFFVYRLKPVTTCNNRYCE